MITMLLYRAADLAVGVLPAPLADRMAVGLARLAFAIGVPARGALERNLGRLVGTSDRRTVRRLARQGFEHFALSFADFLRLGRIGAPGLRGAIEVHGERHLAAARRSGRGVILLSAHLGSWECGAAWLASRGIPLRLVARPHRSRLVERFFARRRGAWGVRRLHERPLWRAVAGALRRGEWVALMADRCPPDARGSVCAFAAALARRTGALVVPAVMVRLPDRRHAAFVEPPVGPDRVGAHDIRDTLRGYLRRYPAQWSAFEPLPEGLA
jgi:KDO2-lipid IV(A) lauroyltransferase